jgi:hypothetical protein
MTTNRPIETYRDFWPYYLQEHAKPETRAAHYLGTGLAVASVLALLFTGNGWFGAVALVAGYGPAWFGHFFLEKNRPATFDYPLWSLVSDFRMAWSWLTGGLAVELEKAGVTAR